MTVYGYTLLSVFLRYSLPLSVYVLKLLVFPKKKKKSNSASSHLKMVSKHQYQITYKEKKEENNLLAIF